MIKFFVEIIQWCFYRKGEPQPDNYEGIKHGPINAENNIGITIEGLQEFHDEACLAVLNNKYNDGVAWHDVACHFRYCWKLIQSLYGAAVIFVYFDWIS